MAIGGSAGGLGAFFSIFDSLTRLGEKPGMAFIVVLHLSPDEESHLADLLRARTKLPVTVVDSEAVVEVDHVYVLPPGKTFGDRTGALVTQPRAAGSGHHPVDDLFRSTSRLFGERSVAIVCSGTGSNGSAGLGAIREAGGCALAQDPSTAEFDEMPRRAIGTGLVDLVLPADAMVEALIRNGRRLAKAPASEAPASEAASGSGEAAQPEPEHQGSDDAFARILTLLEDRASIDFRQYKTGTLHRRIERRATLKHLEDWNLYADLLKEDAHELDALLNDLLITVTGFFRDAGAWEILARHVIEPMVRNRSHEETLRVWTAGCATDEEAYSAGISIFEAAGSSPAKFPVEIFATDKSLDALSRARAGRYPAASTRHLPEALRTRWFTEKDDVITVRPALRELMIFAPQNLIQDPPFSRADLVICRNVLIYLKPETQRKLIRLFHFSLKEGGCLFLGNAEGIGDATDLFEPVDRSSRVYRRVGPTRHDIVEFPLMRSRRPRHSSAAAKVDGTELSQQEDSDTKPIAEMAMKAMVFQYAPPSVLIDEDATVLYYHGATYRFFKPPSGEATHNLLALAHDSLVPDLRRVIEVARNSGRTEAARLRIPFGERVIVLLIEATRVSEPGEPVRLLVSFHQEMTPPRTSADAEGVAEAPDYVPDDEVGLLRAAALASTRMQEELTAYNEEMTSMNEELRASNEELETSKEELQSLNEELNTVNSQLHGKVAELEERTADLNNLLGSTDVATLFLDNELGIRWFSPSATALFHLRQGDLGRPISHVVRTFVDDALEEECRQVLRTLIPVEAQVTRQDGHTFNRRISPYRTLDDRIAGVVVSLNDVTALTEARYYAEQIVETTPVPMLVLDDDLRIRSANPAFYAAFKLTPDAAERQLIYDLEDGRWGIPELRRLLNEVLPHDHAFRDYEVEHDFGATGEKVLRFSGCRIDHMQLILLSIEDVTERRRSESRQAMLMAELGHRVKNALGVAQALASQTVRTSGSLDQFRERFSERLSAYSRSHDLLFARDWKAGELGELIRDGVGAHAGSPDRFDIEGPRLHVPPSQALALGLILHELETNAVKYGALSNDSGRVEIRWTVDGGNVDLLWREYDGSIVTPPEHEGFGSTLIRQLATSEFGGTAKLLHAAEGFACRLQFPAPTLIERGS